MARRRYLDPFECEINSLGPKGVGVAVAPDGNPVHVRPAAPGSRVAVVAAGRRKGVWRSRRQALIRPPAEGQVPPCPQFGTCGGCQLQELQLTAQRRHKAAFALSQVQQHIGPLTDVRIHPVRGTDAAFRYRNKVELSFGPRRWVPEADHASGAATEGSFLGFHAPGRFDRVVDASECWLVSEAMNEVLAIVRTCALHPDAPPPYDPRSHEGQLRHLLLREADDGILAVIFTAHDTPAIAAWAEALALALVDRVVGLQWRT
nr:hypothetical protein [Myxococcales bacterium]